MNAADVVGYTLDRAAYCGEGCLPEGVDPEGEGVGAIFAGAEWDSYPVCDTCHGRIEDVSLVYYRCKGCGHHGPNAEETGNPDACRACHKAPPALRAMLEESYRAHDTPGELDARAWPGGYPILYITKCGETLCAACATAALRSDDDDPPVAYDIYYAGRPESCAACGEELASAYGEPAGKGSESEPA
jgi:hypothetical protein